MSKADKIIAVTVGEPAGIGPDIVVTLAQSPRQSQWFAIADPAVLTDRAALLGLPLQLETYDFQKPVKTAAKHLSVLPLQQAIAVTAGVPDARNAGYVIDSIATAVDLCMSKQIHAMVTGPVDKSVINQGGIAFCGHTEYIAKRTHAPQPVMMMVGGETKVALATWHIPLKAVPDAITAGHLSHVIHIVHHDLQQRFGIDQPRIAVCGLNPHAGERGYLGQEEITVMIPVIEKLQAAGLNLTGPVAADSVFATTQRQQYDVIIAMYHDQGLAPIKALHFHDAVNITLGLPIVRTSVDHGTAYSLAGRGGGSIGSLASAIRWALWAGVKSELRC